MVKSLERFMDQLFRFLNHNFELDIDRERRERERERERWTSRRGHGQKALRKNKEDWVVIDGTRYFRSGDIGQIKPDGTLSIIDRKKDRGQINPVNG